jgi:hypothetical protein
MYSVYLYVCSEHGVKSGHFWALGVSSDLNPPTVLALSDKAPQLNPSNYHHRSSNSAWKESSLDPLTSEIHPDPFWNPAAASDAITVATLACPVCRPHPLARPHRRLLGGHVAGSPRNMAAAKPPAPARRRPPSCCPFSPWPIQSSLSPKHTSVENAQSWRRIPVRYCGGGRH